MIPPSPMQQMKSTSFAAHSAVILLLSMVLSFLISNTSCQLMEHERVKEYLKRNHHWPPLPSDYKPPKSPGWQAIFERRLAQVERISDGGSKYNGFMSTVHSALIAPNFTEFGWALTRGPPDLVQELLEKLKLGVESKDTAVEESEFEVQDEYPNELPLMVDIGRLRDRALVDLKPIMEAWSRMELEMNNAYGLRVYRNQSNLQMHIDESSTHVISAILHVGHDEEGEPWPLVIEDFLGNTHEVYLETGDMVLYESSKCFHGRPKRFNGNWYSSLFLHYFPVNWDAEMINLDTHYRIPPRWDETPDDAIDGVEELVVSETSFKEPACKHEWCGMKDTTKWSRIEGLSFGQYLSPDGKILPLGLDGSMKREEL